MPCYFFNGGVVLSNLTKKAKKIYEKFVLILVGVAFFNFYIQLLKVSIILASFVCVIGVMWLVVLYALYSLKS